MKDQTSQEFHRKCTKCGPLKNSEYRKYQRKSKLLKNFIENVLSVDLWKIPTHGKYRWKSKLLENFIEGNVLSVDLWEIPHSENIEERTNFSRVSSECAKYIFLKNSTLRKSRWKSELLKSFIVNVQSVYLRKIPLLENIDERPNFSRVSSQMYYVWTFEKFNS